MRRFEREERFWEIGIEGRNVVTWSGKIGAKPRESLSRHSSATQATRDHDNKLAKRLGEGGWTEVRTRIVVDFSSEPQILGLDATQVAQWSALPNTLAIDGAQAARAVRHQLAKEMPLWKAGRARLEGNDPEVLAAMRRLLKSGPEHVRPHPIDIMVLFTMVPSPEAADLALAACGVEAVVEAVANGPKLHLGHSLKERWLEPGDRPDASPKWPVVHLGMQLRRAAATDWIRASRLASDALQRATDPQNMLDLCTMFPGADWVDAFAAQIPPQSDNPRMPFAPLLSPAGFEALVGATAPVYAARLVPAANTLLHRDGLAAADSMRQLGVKLGAQGVDLLARLPSKQTALVLVDALDLPDTTDSARAVLLGMTGWALIALADRTRSGEALALAEELASSPEIIEAIDPMLTSTERRRIQRWASMAVDHTVPTQLPPLLAAPLTGAVPRWLRVSTLPRLMAPDASRSYPNTVRTKVAELLTELTPALSAELLAVIEAGTLSAFTLAILHQWNDREADGIYQASPWTKEITDEEHGTYRWRRDPNAPEVLECPWPLTAATTLGDPPAVQVISNYILAWSKRPGRYKELVNTAIGNLGLMPHRDDVLLALSTLEQKLTKNSVVIELHLKRLAKEQNIKPSELQEVLLPRFDLDAGARTRLDFGSRAFVGCFDERLQPYLLDATGARVRSLPKPNAGDDPLLAKQAKSHWSHLRKSVKSVHGSVLKRLEAGLRTQRKWRAEHFLQHLAHHPLAGVPVRGLVWRTGNELFRIDETGNPVDRGDEPVLLGDWVRLPHPLQLTHKLRSKWSDVFADYELMQPFQQLARERFDGPPEVDALSIPAAGLFALRHWGWKWELTDDGLHGLRLKLGGWQVSISGQSVDPAEPNGFVASRIALFKGSWDQCPPHIRSEIHRDIVRAHRA